MTFEEMAEALGALGRIVAERRGDRGAMAAAEAFLRAQGDVKPAAFTKAVAKAAKGGLRLPRATEVRAGAAAEALEALTSLLKALGTKDAAVKAVEAARKTLADHAQLSLDALTEALEAERVAAEARAAKRKK
ncbi:MAG: hypothetical protein AAGM38_05790 [Pseudomonadota bacterium]